MPSCWSTYLFGVGRGRGRGRREGEEGGEGRRRGRGRIRKVSGEHWERKSREEERGVDIHTYHQFLQYFEKYVVSTTPEFLS
jgi:hypothetical protein